MNKLNFMLGMGILCTIPTSALESPFTGSVPPEEGSAVFYLYHVETQQWFRDNCTKGGSENDVRNIANMGKVGLDIEVTKIDGGYQLNPKMGHNHSINAKGLKMTTDAPVTTWTFEPVSEEESGVKNAFHIVAVNGNDYNETDYPRTLGVDKDNWLSTRNNDNVKGTTWQLVSPEERLAYMQANAGVDGADDATWLIPAQDITTNDERAAQWAKEYTQGPHGSNIAIGGIPRAVVNEAWNDPHGYVHYITLTDLPNGTYEMRLQGYYRESLTEISWNRYRKGMTPMQPKYFAGGAMNSLRHAISEHFTGDKPSDHNWRKAIFIDEWVPDGLNAAAFWFTDHDKFQNEWIKTVVTDGTLTLGVYKANSTDLDWTVYDNFQLRYISDSTEGKEAEFQAMIDNEVMPLFTELTEEDLYPAARPQAIQDALEAVATAYGEGDMNATRIAYLRLIKELGVYLKRDVIAFRQLYAAAKDDVEDPEQYLAEFEAATGREGVTSAIDNLRKARRKALAERHEDHFTGSQPEVGQWYYLYNVGQDQFLQAGNQWGARTSLGYVGSRIELLDPNDEGYKIHTGIHNPDTQCLLNGNVWMDTNEAGRYTFVPVDIDGMENVYYFKNSAGHFYVHSPYADNQDMTYVINSSEDQTGNPDAMWKLVKESDRTAMTSQASKDNPIDLSFLISCPNFTYRENQDDWNISENGGGRNGKDGDLVFESWNKQSLEMGQEIAGLPSGYYQVSVQGYFRNGSHFDCPDYDRGDELNTFYAEEMPDANAIETYADEAGATTIPSHAEAPLANILDCTDASPAEGDDTYSYEGTSYNIPNSVSQAAKFFQIGKYKNTLTINKTADGTNIKIGVKKPQAAHSADWVVLDNFRLKYFGTQITDGIENVEAEKVAEAEAEANAPVYNLQGIRVSDTTVPGIYIRNGRKFVVK